MLHSVLIHVRNRAPLVFARRWSVAAGTALFGFVVAAFVEQASAAGVSGWPVFRGSAALTGVAEGRLPEKPALLWTFKTGGPVKSSAVMGGGRAFIGSDDM